MTTDSSRAGFEFAVRFIRAQNDRSLFASATAVLAELAKIDADKVRAIAEIADHTRQQVKSEDPKVTTSISSRITVEMAGLLNDGFSLAETAEACIYPFFSNAGGNDSERTYMKQLVQKYLPVAGGTQTPWENVGTNTNDPF